MVRQKGDLSKFQVNRKSTATDGSTAVQEQKEQRRLITKGFQVTSEGAQQFDMLKAELGPGKKGPELIAEALNLLFDKYNKLPVA